MWSGKFKNGESFNDLTDDEIEKFSNEIDESSVKEFKAPTAPQVKSGYSYTNPDQYEDLKRNISEVGYSGLDDEQKKLFGQQFGSSKFAQAGGTIQDAIKYVDESAGVNEANKNAGNAYTLGRDLISIPVSFIGGALEYGKDRAFGEGDWAAGEKPYMDYVKENLELGNAGEGLPGMASDPVNVVGFGAPIAKPATGMATTLASKIPVAGKWFAESPNVMRGVGGAVEGAGLTAGSEYADPNKRLDFGDVALGGLISGGVSSVTGRPTINQQEVRGRAIDQFPGTNYFKTQARKEAIPYSESDQYLTDAEKLDIMQNIPAPYDAESWIRYYEGLASRNKQVYDEASNLAKTQSWEGASIPMDQIAKDLTDKLGAGVGTYSNKDVAKFVKDRLAGFNDKYRATGEMPIHEMGLLKGKLNEDIFDPRAAVTEGLTTKRALARKAGKVIEGYRNNIKAYMDPDMKLGDIPGGTDELSKMLSNYTVEPISAQELANLSKEEVTNYLTQLAAFNKSLEGISELIRGQGKSYNELLQGINPKIKREYAKQAILEDIFQHQPISTGSSRKGKGLLGTLWEGAEHRYTPTGDAYADPIKLLMHERSIYPKVIEGVGKLGKGLFISKQTQPKTFDEYVKQKKAEKNK